MRIALVSVTDKTGIVEFCRRLQTLGYRIVSTGGTARVLKENNVEVSEVSEITGFPEIMDGRVKTLHPKLHGGILFDRSKTTHAQHAKDHGIEAIDIVVVNLYKFAEKAAKENLPLAAAIEHVDIGGPTMIRAAAKNYQHCIPVMDPADYETVASELEAQGTCSEATRAALAAKVFHTMAHYDGMIAQYFSSKIDPHGAWPASFAWHGNKVQDLRYGENPHQNAAFYAPDRNLGLAAGQILQGKELSYNNLLDLDAACALVADFPQSPAVVIIKHTNPCGVAVACGTLCDTYTAALAGDPVSAFGGIIASNVSIDTACAELMAQTFFECIAAPDFSEGARKIFAEKKNLRLLKIGIDSYRQGLDRQIRTVSGGCLVQDYDCKAMNAKQWQNKSKTQPSATQLADLEIAMIIAKHVKSNAITLVRDKRSIGIGAGQMSRIDAAHIAISKAQKHGHSLAGAALGSDAFFPFRDTVDLAAQSGISAIAQPGGSVRDAESITACDQHGICMLFTETRHFRH